MNKKILVPLITAGLVTSLSVNASILSAVFGEFAGASSKAAASKIINNGCLFSKNYIDKISASFIDGELTDTHKETQYAFAKTVTAEFLYSSNSAVTNTINLTNFMETSESGSVVVVCPYPLTGVLKGVIHVCMSPDATGDADNLFFSAKSGALAGLAARLATPGAPAPALTGAIVDMQAGLDKQYTGMRIIGVGDVGGDITYVPIAADAVANSALTTVTGDQEPDAAGPHTAAGAATVGVCPAGTSTGTECNPSEAADSTNTNIASYQLFVFGESTGTANPDIDGTLWQIQYEFKNVHLDAVSGQNAMNYNGTLEVTAIGGALDREFDASVINAAANCNDAGFVK